jgi:hypothetical protein
MAWKIYTGVDRCGKSTVAEYYEKQGYKIIHLTKPGKKHYRTDGINSYLNEMLEMYLDNSGKDIFWDRSIYDELVFPEIYGRKSLLSLDDIEILREIEDQNNCEYVYMYDENMDKHWERCVRDNEPLNPQQFIKAYDLFEKNIVQQFSFQKLTLPQFLNTIPQEESIIKQEVEIITKPLEKQIEKIEEKVMSLIQDKTILDKLEYADNLKKVLDMDLIKKKNNPYLDQIELEIKKFILSKINSIFSPNEDTIFTKEETVVLKTFVQNVINKQKV